MLTHDDRQRLAEMRQAAAQADSPSPWVSVGGSGVSDTWYGQVRTADDEGCVVAEVDCINDCAHIASASPDRVLWLLDLVERMAPMPRCSICRSDDCRQDHACE
jgi:hypothetical protein